MATHTTTYNNPHNKDSKGQIAKAIQKTLPVDYKPVVVKTIKTAADMKKNLTTLFGKDMKPNIQDIKQGQLGDCWYLSVLGALAHSDPQLITDNVKIIEKGVYEVTLYDYFSGSKESIRVNEEEINHAYANKVDGIYVQVYEVALSKYYSKNEVNFAFKEKYPTLNAFLNSVDKYTDTIANKIKYGDYSGINAGDTAVAGIKIITNSDSRWIPNDQSQFDTFLDQKRYEKQISIASTYGCPNEDTKTFYLGKYKMYYGHAYIICGVEGDKIKLYNPHGENITYFGLSKDDGYLTISIEDFKQKFGGITTTDTYQELDTRL